MELSNLAGLDAGPEGNGHTIIALHLDLHASELHNGNPSSAADTNPARTLRESYDIMRPFLQGFIVGILGTILITLLILTLIYR